MAEPRTISIAAGELRRIMSFAQEFIQRRSHIPILREVRLTATRGKLTARATDLDIWASVWAEAEAQSGDLDAMLPAGPILDVIRHAQGNVQIEQSDEIVTITAGFARIELRSLTPADDYPEPTVKGDVRLPVRLSEAVLRKTLQLTLPVVSTEETRYYLNGVHLVDRGDGLVAEATDGHRLARYETGEGWGLHEVILPREAAERVKRHLRPGGNSEIAVSSIGEAGKSGGGRALRFTADGWEVFAKTIDGAFPDVDRVIPKIEGEPKFRATLTDDAMKLFPRGGRDERPMIKIDPEAGVMSVSSHASNYTVTLPVTAKGPQIGVNAAYLRGFAGRSGTIRLASTDPGAPILIETADPRLTQVVMPMRV